MRWIALCLITLLAAPPARAEWAYTRWGMTPQEVVAASGGKAELLPANSRRDSMPLEPGATGTFNEGPLEIRTTFVFATKPGGLQCVAYGVGDHADDEAFKAALIKRYGPPKTKTAVAMLGQDQLGWQTATDEINATFSKSDPAFVMQCAKKK